MKWIKTFISHKESIKIVDVSNLSDLMESLNIWQDVLLSSVSAEKVDIFQELKLPVDDFKSILDIKILSDNVSFINSLSSLGLKKSQIQDSEDFESFINKPCKFMLIYDSNSNELENPEYILFQTWNSAMKKWDDCNLFKINDKIEKFYNKLSSKTIEIVDGDQKYIYSTSNGNDWELQNLNLQNDIYTRFFTKEDLQNLIEDRKLSINII